MRTGLRINLLKVCVRTFNRIRGQFHHWTVSQTTEGLSEPSQVSFSVQHQRCRNRLWFLRTKVRFEGLCVKNLEPASFLKMWVCARK